MNWIEIKSENDLPEEGKYVLARHNLGTWGDKSDPENVNCIVVKLVKGISLSDRKQMQEGKKESFVSEIGVYYGENDMPISKEYKRHEIYKAEDEHWNNTVPYNWVSFGNRSFNGQEITHWAKIEPVTK